ncbi:response regulator receiver protein [Candidatus Vecturithrix granuli]|uniref:Response regulator receiver protein n=1 Tax=Vecturithrix granuli TaxID=1499967 RepID=A0A081BX98_VECG1|nr:response regulator receiver protein [Candidatus Vecturithrix granuli]
MEGEKTILLVDDDRDFVASNRDLLEAYGYTVLTAYDGNSGLETAQREHPALIVLDVIMNHVTEGFETAKKIRKLPELRETKILMVSAATPEMKLWASSAVSDGESSAEHLLEKPIDPAKFIATIEEMLGND